MADMDNYDNGFKHGFKEGYKKALLKIVKIDKELIKDLQEL